MRISRGRATKIKAAAFVFGEGVQTSAPEATKTVSADCQTDASRGQPNMEDSETPIVLDVNCGPNTAKFYLDKVQMGSKGQCVFFEDSWLTPNEFQFVSGRETAKDWKRSIKHHDKSLKLLMSRGLLSLSPAECRCEHCTEGVPVAEKKASSERGNVSPAVDGSSSPQAEVDSPSQKNSNAMVDKENNEIHSAVKTENRKQKVKKRRRDKSPKVNKRTKKQRRSRESSECEKNILKLKRVEDSEEYVSSVLSSPRKCEENKVSSDQHEITENETGTPDNTEKLSAYDEDTDNYVDEMDEEEGESQIETERSTSISRPNSPDDTQTGVIAADDNSSDDQTADDSLPDQSHLHGNQQKSSEITGTGKDEHTNKQEASQVPGHALSPEQPSVVVGTSDVNEAAKPTPNTVQEIGEIHVTPIKTVKNIVDTAAVVFNGNHIREDNNTSPPIKREKDSYYDNKEHGFSVEKYTNKDAEPVEDTRIKTVALSSDKHREPHQTDSLIDVKFSPKKECRLTSIIDQLRTYKNSLTMTKNGTSNQQDCVRSLDVMQDRHCPDVSGQKFKHRTSSPVQRRPLATESNTSPRKPLSPSSPREPQSTKQSAWSPREPKSTKQSAWSPREPQSTTQSPWSPREPQSTTQSAWSPREPKSTTQSAWSPREPKSTTQSPWSPREPQSKTQSPWSPREPQSTTQSPWSPREPQSTTQSPWSPREPQPITQYTKQSLSLHKEPSSISLSPVNLNYYHLLKSHAEAIRKAEGGNSKYIPKDDQTASLKGAPSPPKTPKSEASVHKHGGAGLSKSKPAVSDYSAHIPTTNPAVLPGYAGGYPSHLGVPYMPYPYYHPALVPTSGLPTTGVPPEALANSMLYSSLYGMHPTLAAGLGAGGLGAADVLSKSGLGYGHLPASPSSTPGNCLSGLSDHKPHVSAKDHTTSRPSIQLSQHRDYDSTPKGNKLCTSVSSQRHSLSGTVDLSRKAEFAYDQSGALDLTSSLKRPAEEKRAKHTVKKPRGVENHKHKSLDSTFKVYCDAVGEGYREGHREGQQGHRHQGHTLQTSPKSVCTERSKTNLHGISVASKFSCPLSNASSVSAAGLPSASLTAAMASAHAAALAHGYPNGSPYANAMAAGMNPAALGLMHYPLLYPFSV